MNTTAEFRNQLEGIVNQKLLETTINEYYKLPLLDNRRPSLLERMVLCLRHPSFSSVLFFHRCPGCKALLRLGGVDKGSAFVCEACGETEEMFMRHIYL